MLPIYVKPLNGTTMKLINFKVDTGADITFMDEDKDFRNLLGRDLLVGFNYTFDNDNDIFSIHRTKSLKKRYGFHPGQEISVIDISGGNQS